MSVMWRHFSIYALLCGEKLIRKLCMQRKMTNMRYVCGHGNHVTMLASQPNNFTPMVITSLLSPNLTNPVTPVFQFIEIYFWRKNSSFSAALAQSSSHRAGLRLLVSDNSTIGPTKAFSQKLTSLTKICFKEYFRLELTKKKRASARIPTENVD